MKKYLVVLYFIYALSLASYSQKISLKCSGFIYDSNSNESIINATVYSLKSKSIATSNNYGYFQMQITPDDSLLISFVGYEKQYITNIYTDTILSINLESTNNIEEIDVYANTSKVNNFGTFSLQSKEIENIPQLLGEKDVLKAFQMLPGIQGGLDGTSGIHVRGGSPDQNLILLDGICVYNVNHLFGLFSIFNTDAINNANLHKNYIPTKYAGRISSVLDISMKEGNMSSYHGNFGIGLLSSKFLVEGPLLKEKSSFIISARRTYIDWIARPFVKKIADGSVVGYYFYDINAKANYKVNEQNRLFLSIYTGKDKYYSTYKTEGYNHDNVSIAQENNEKLFWGNITTALRWNSIINKSLYSNLSFSYSNYNVNNLKNYIKTTSFNDNSLSDGYSIEHRSEIKDIAINWNCDLSLPAQTKLRFGLSAINHNFKPGAQVNYIGGVEGELNIDTTRVNSAMPANEMNLYAEIDYNLFTRLTMNAGIRGSIFETKNIIYHHIEPRLNLAFSFDETFLLGASYNNIFQPIQLLVTSNIGLPTDMWILSTREIKPALANQISFYSKKQITKQWNFILESFYKKMNNLVEFKEGASFLLEGKEWHEKIEQGQGEAFGIEMMVEKNKGKLNGWISYTLSKSSRLFPEINNGLKFPYKYDRRNYLNITAFYKQSSKVDYSLNWIFSSGARFTFVGEDYKRADSFYQKKYFPQSQLNNIASNYDTKNGFSLPNYHRLDIGVNFHKTKKRFVRTLSVGLYNTYCKLNPVYIIGDKNGLYGYSLIPIIPYFNYNIKF